MSDEPARKQSASHPVRLAFLMLVGAWVGFVFSPAAGNLLDPWFRAAPFVYALIGSMIGLSIDFYLRLEDKRVSREFLLASVIAVVLAIAWAMVH